MTPALNYLPEALRQYPVFQVGTLLIDSAIADHFADPVAFVDGVYDVNHEGFDEDYLLKMFSGDLFARLGVSTDDRKSLALLASSILNLKGTARGLRLVLAFMGLDGQFKSWYEVNGNPAEYGLEERLDPCTIVLTIRMPLVGTRSLDQVQAAVQDLVNRFLWVCIKVEYMWTLYVEVTIPIAGIGTEVEGVVEAGAEESLNLREVCGLRKLGLSSTRNALIGEFQIYKDLTGPFTRSAFVGNFGEAGAEKADLVAMVEGYKPSNVFLVGNVNGPDFGTMNDNVGQYWGRRIFPWNGGGAEPDRGRSTWAVSTPVEVVGVQAVSTEMPVSLEVGRGVKLTNGSSVMVGYLIRVDGEVGIEVNVTSVQSTGSQASWWVEPWEARPTVNGVDVENSLWAVPGELDVSDEGDVNAFQFYFTLPYVERYYPIVLGNVEYFCINSEEPGGLGEDSLVYMKVAEWASQSTARWKVVVVWGAPRSSVRERGDLDWPFEDWGIDLVISGDPHFYERIVDGIPFLSAGTGGGTLEVTQAVHDEDIFRASQYGALFVDASEEKLVAWFTDVRGVTLDRVVVGNEPKLFGTVSSLILLESESWRIGQYNGLNHRAFLRIGASTDLDSYIGGCRGLEGTYPSERTAADGDTEAALGGGFSQEPLRIGDFSIEAQGDGMYVGALRAALPYILRVIIAEEPEPDEMVTLASYPPEVEVGRLATEDGEVILTEEGEGLTPDEGAGPPQ